METAILILISSAMIITSIVNFAKPAYQDFVGKYAVSINIALSFILGVCAAFAVRPYLDLDLSAGALTLIWLALGTWATIFYDIWSLIQGFGSKLRKEEEEFLIELPEEEDERQD